MILRGAAVIVGSLIWEDHLVDEEKDNRRKNWREDWLNIEEGILIPFPIRYARISGPKRKGTFTMALSKSCEDIPGTALAFPFKELVQDFDYLYKQAVAMAEAEGIFKMRNPRLTCNWGSVGLIANPRIAKETAEIIDRWQKVYRQYSPLILGNYKADSEHEPVLNSDGCLNLDWRPEWDHFDLLIATPVVVERALPTPEIIADKISSGKYPDYFKQNIKHGIQTFQDVEILKCIEQPKET